MPPTATAPESAIAAACADTLFGYPYYPQQ
jgi:hypothetical protein